MVRRIGLLISAILMTCAITAFLFAHVFTNMAALSIGFIARKNSAVMVAWIGLIASTGLYALIHRPFAKAMILRRYGFLVLASGVLAWLSFAGLVYVMQDQLVFSPRSLSPDRQARIGREYPSIEEITIPVDAHARLHGWLLPNETKAPAPLVILFAGQGGEASRYLEFATRLQCCAWAFINYRGYGLSTGTPSDTNLFSDAILIYDFLSRHPHVDESKIFAIGGSLGAGIATYLSAKRPLAGVILFSPYDRIGGGVAQDLMPFVPTRLLITNGFDALQHAPNTRASALAIVGEEDSVIRPKRSQTLMESWGQPHQLITVPGGDHYTIYEDDAVWHSIEAFFEMHLHDAME